MRPTQWNRISLDRRVELLADKVFADEPTPEPVEEPTPEPVAPVAKKAHKKDKD